MNKLVHKTLLFLKVVFTAASLISVMDDGQSGRPLRQSLHGLMGFETFVTRAENTHLIHTVPALNAHLTTFSEGFIV